MPRAFCPECGSEVPVDDDGICHVGHHVDTGTTPAGADDDADEPQPWVASVDSPTPGGSTPPAGDAPLAGDDLAAAAAAAVGSVEPSPEDAGRTPGPDPVEGHGDQVEAGWPQTLPSEGEAPGWTPPTNDPVAPPPVPPPAPVDPPAPAAGDDDDFDLDGLAAAVSEMGMDDAAPAPSTPTAAAPTDPVRPVDGAAPTDDHAAWEDDLGEPDAGPATADGTAEDGPAAPAPATDTEPVDLSNFTAKGGRASSGGGKGGRFRRR